MFTPRYYQQEAHDAVFDYLEREQKNPLVVLPTGTGKSGLIAMCAQTCMIWSGTKVLVLAHRQELISQNVAEMLTLWPEAPAGIYHAGLRRREATHPIVFCGINSVYNKAELFSPVHLLIVDEAHRIPREQSTMYARFIHDLKRFNPSIKVVGLTATHWRTKGGLLTEDGPGRIFSDVVYDYKFCTAVDDGYLTRISTRQTDFQIDYSDVRVTAGEYNLGDQLNVVDNNAVTDRILDEILARLDARGHWLAFCTGIEHADRVRDGLVRRDVAARSLNHKTPADERAAAIRWAKTSRDSALCSMDILTTGYNDPSAWFMAGLRKTKSSGLYVQMAGRISRPVYAKGMPLDTAEQRKAAIAAGPKPYGLYFDFAGNVDEHGPIDMIDPKKLHKRDSKGMIPMKTCPQCGEQIMIATTSCPHCGFVFPKPELQIVPVPSQAPLLSIDLNDWLAVEEVSYRMHASRTGKPPSFLVRYVCGFKDYKDYHNPEHSPGAAWHFAQWWIRNGGKAPAPNNVALAVGRYSELDRPTHIRVKKDGDYWRVVATRCVPDLPAQASERVRSQA